MLKKSHELFADNERFEGFCVDLLKEISHIVGFQYQIEPVADGKYGVRENGHWTGMVRQLLEKVSLVYVIFCITIETGKVGLVLFTN